MRVDAAVLAAVPALAEDADLRVALARSTRANLADVLALLADPGLPVDNGVPPEALALATTLVRRGVEPGDLVHAYLVGQNELWRAWMEEVGARLESGPELIGALLRDAGMGGGEASRALGYDIERCVLAAVLWDSGAGEDPPAPFDGLEACAAALARAAGAPRALTLPSGTASMWAWVGTPERPDVEHVSATIARDLPPGRGIPAPPRGADPRATWTKQELDQADLRLGSVQHPWPKQGLTVERLHYVHDTLANARSTYVAGTRPRGEFHLCAARETLERIRDDRDQPELDVLAESLGQPEKHRRSTSRWRATPTAASSSRTRAGLHRDPIEVAPSPVNEGAVVAREDVHVPDPLDHIRETLGSDRAARPPDVPAPAQLETVEAEQLQAPAWRADRHAPARGRERRSRARAAGRARAGARRRRAAPRPMDPARRAPGRRMGRRALRARRAPRARRPRGGRTRCARTTGAHPPDARAAARAPGRPRMPVKGSLPPAD